MQSLGRDPVDYGLRHPQIAIRVTAQPRVGKMLQPAGWPRGEKERVACVRQAIVAVGASLDTHVGRLP